MSKKKKGLNTRSESNVKSKSLVESESRLVIGRDWPMSMGLEVHLISNSRYLLPEFRVKVDIDDVFTEVFPDDEDVSLIMGCACARPELGKLFVVLRDRKSVSDFISVLVHELSHILDYFVWFAGSDSLDTETRAYHLQWFTENFFLCFSQEAWWPGEHALEVLRQRTTNKPSHLTHARRVRLKSDLLDQANSSRLTPRNYLTAEDLRHGFGVHKSLDKG